MTRALLGPVTDAPPDLCVEIPMNLPSRANQASGQGRWHRHKLVKEQRAAVESALLGKTPPQLPVTVRLSRIAPCKLDDDNLRGSLKATRDQVAQWFGVDDRDPSVWWIYPEVQEKDQCGRPKYQAARIEIWRGQIRCSACNSQSVPAAEGAA